MKIKIQYDKNKHQCDFHRDIKSRRLHLSTGFGGGKTYALCMKALQLSMLNKGHAGGFMAPSYKEFKKDCLPTIEDILDQNRIKYEYNKTDMFFKFPWSKAPMYVVSGQEKIRGPNWAYACINELTIIPLVRYKEIIARVRIKKAPFPQIASCGTPEGWANEYYEYMIEKPRAKTRIIYGSSKDNVENLDEDYISDLYDSYDSIMQAAYIEGEWVNMGEDLFYYSYDVKRNEDETLKFGQYEMAHIGIDFNVKPMSATVWVQRKGKLLGVDEVTIKDNATTEKLARALIARGYTPDNSILYPDPSGDSRSTKGQPDIKILENAGYYEIRRRSKAPGMRQRQLNTNNLLAKGTVVINPDKMPEMRKDFMAVQQDPVKLDKIKKNPDRTHHSDGFDYVCDILYPFKGRETTRVTSQRYR